MKHYVCLILFLCCNLLYVQAQEKNCALDYEVVNDTINFKQTKELLVYEDSQEKSTQALYFSLIKSDDNNFLQVQLIQKSTDFIPITCVNYRSIISIKLNNGRIISAYYIGDEKCDTFIYNNETKNNIRLLSTVFLLRKEDINYLKESPIVMVQIRYANKALPYPIKNELEFNSTEPNSQPSAFFIENIPCLE